MSDVQNIFIPQALQAAMGNLQKGDLDAAEKFCRLALEAEPENHIGLYIFGLVCKARGNAESAIASFENALKANGNFAEAANVLGLVLIEEQRFDEAAFNLRIAVANRQEYPEAHNNLGVALKALGDLDGAVLSFEKSIKQNPDVAETLDNLAMACCQLGRLDEAKALLEKALTIAPDYPEALNDLGITLHDMGRYDEAVGYYQKALTANPDYEEADYNFGLCLLLEGEFPQGWKKYEKRYSKKNPEPGTARGFDQPQWDGAPLDGKTILLLGEQGAGDSIQFIRYADRIKQTGATVVVECAPELKTLFGTVAGVDTLVSTGEDLPDFDVYAPLLSLPHILGMQSVDDIPNAVPYLAAAGETTAARPTASASKHVGFVWAGSKGHQNDANRSVAPERFAPLVGKDGLTFYSLQTGARAAEIIGQDFYADINDVGQKLGDYAMTATFMEQLDLVITVDTAVAHLAGALGKEVWTLLPFVPDFRWMLERPDSPWYPTMRLFRQPKLGDWDSVFAAVAAALEDL